MTYAELTSESARTLSEWCDKPHAGYGARIHDDTLMVWVGGNPYVFPSAPGVSTTIPMAHLTCWWRNRVADALHDLKQSLLEN